jgi:hypothetical protein
MTHANDGEVLTSSALLNPWLAVLHPIGRSNKTGGANSRFT